MLIETENPACVGASVQVAVGCMGLAFGILGIEIPGGALVADMVQTNSRAVSLILDIVRQMDKLDDYTKVALDVRDILKVLYDEGIFSAALKESLKDKSWWEWSKMIAQINATVALWFIPGAGQAAFLLQAGLALIDAMDVIDGLKDMKKHCVSSKGKDGQKDQQPGGKPKKPGGKAQKGQGKAKK